MGIDARGKKRRKARLKRLRNEAKAMKMKRAEQEHKESEKLLYVHVRALRGQATDNHGLAERAKREKINAWMKLLQELVPGCSKISGTALVLDEIINHVQSLQRQIEFLSMRLAAVYPRLDFSNLDSFFFSEGCSLMAGCLAGMMAEDPLYPDLHFNTLRRWWRQLQQHVDVVPLSSWERADCFVNISFESDLDSTYSVSLHLN